MIYSGESYDISLPDELSSGDVMSSREDKAVEDKAVMLSYHMATRMDYRTMCFTLSLTGGIEMNSFWRLQQSVMKMTTSQVISLH